MKERFNFLLVEFEDILYIINKIWAEKDIKIVARKLLKLINEVIIKAHLKNNIFYNPENTLIESIDVLYKKNIIPYEFLRYLINYIEEIKHLDKILVKKDLVTKNKEIFERLLKNEDFIYELSVWLVTNAGEENYHLFIDSLDGTDRELFIKYIYFKNNCLEEENEDFIDLPLEDEDTNYSLESDKLTAEENLIKGELYYLGTEVEKDYKKAKKYFEKAAEYGNKSAEGYLGLFYEKGYGVEKDIEEALYWYKEAAYKGDIFSKYSLGYIYYEGKEVERNLTSSFKWYKEAAEEGFAPAQYALSYLYKNGEGCEKSIFKAYYWLEECADNDFKDAYYILGKSYLDGNFIEENYKKAFFYLSKGCEINDEKSLELLAEMYYYGMYVNKDNKKAIELYNRSIEEGNTETYYMIGLIYEEENDIKNALINYYKGHANECIRCTKRLGVLYYDGKLVKENKEKAIEFFKICAKYGNAYSLYFLAIEYYKNNEKERKKYLLEAYKRGSCEAVEVLIEDEINNFLNGKLVDKYKLVVYANMLIDNNEPSGEYYYGLLYYYGIYFEKNTIKALSNILKSAENGYEKAIKFIPKSVIDF